MPLRVSHHSKTISRATGHQHPRRALIHHSCPTGLTQEPHGQRAERGNMESCLFYSRVRVGEKQRWQMKQRRSGSSFSRFSLQCIHSSNRERESSCVALSCWLGLNHDNLLTRRFSGRELSILVYLGLIPPYQRPLPSGWPCRGPPSDLPGQSHPAEAGGDD